MHNVLTNKVEKLMQQLRRGSSVMDLVDNEYQVIFYCLHQSLYVKAELLNLWKR